MRMPFKDEDRRREYRRSPARRAARKSRDRERRAPNRKACIGRVPGHGKTNGGGRTRIPGGEDEAEGRSEDVRYGEDGLKRLLGTTRQDLCAVFGDQQGVLPLGG